MSDVFKTITIKNEMYRIKKLSVLECMPIAQMIAAKLPILIQTFLPSQDEKRRGSTLSESEESTLSQKDVEDIDVLSAAMIAAEVLANSTDHELQHIIQICLQHSYKTLNAGDFALMDQNGSYQIPEFEYDLINTLIIVKEVLSFSIASFFPEGFPSLDAIINPISQ